MTKHIVCFVVCFCAWSAYSSPVFLDVNVQMQQSNATAITNNLTQMLHATLVKATTNSARRELMPTWTLTLAFPSLVEASYARVVLAQNTSVIVSSLVSLGMMNVTVSNQSTILFAAPPVLTDKPKNDDENSYNVVLSYWMMGVFTIIGVSIVFLILCCCYGREHETPKNVIPCKIQHVRL